MENLFLVDFKVLVFFIMFFCIYVKYILVAFVGVEISEGVGEDYRKSFVYWAFRFFILLVFKGC